MAGVGRAFASADSSSEVSGDLVGEAWEGGGVARSAVEAAVRLVGWAAVMGAVLVASILWLARTRVAWRVARKLALRVATAWALARLVRAREAEVA